MTVYVPVIGATIVVTLMVLGIIHLADVAEPGAVKRAILPTVALVVAFVIAILVVSSSMS